MALRRSKITREGQVTIPAEFREKLDLHEGDTILFELDDRGLHLVRSEDVVARTAGILKDHAKNGEPFDRDKVWDAIVAERLQRKRDDE